MPIRISRREAGPACHTYQEKGGMTGSGLAFEQGAPLLPPSPQMGRESAPRSRYHQRIAQGAQWSSR